ncbi:sensor histidine kinase [Lacticaseibacillus songhuajiangensis]|jgi:NarL family two-component system sensor histidine kinase YdfH|uniref:sensor histidine kinase n=1 Tax=Lacticaseibacillus songhuajiangensis TaxID=1296539 RepID=UPI000F7A1EA6|nr:sensor histidine kinase [Lacticaseibacillus songhuajiangensis]
MKKKTPYHVLRMPLMLFMLIVGFAAMYVANTASNINLSSGWLTHYSDITQMWQEQIIFGGLLAEEVLLWLGDWLIRRGRLWLLLPQLGFAISTTVALTNQMPVLFFGVIPTMAIEIINLYSRPKQALGYLAGVSLLIWLVYAAYNGWLQGVAVLVGLVFMLLVVIAYWRFFQQQQAARQRAEDLVSELKIAYSQVEESTVRTERQRVARELHDTLTQGLAGTVMQLEAAQAFLQAGKDDRALEVIQGATGIARDTLRDTRLTLTDLRATSEQSLTARLELLAEAFMKNYHLEVSVKMNYVPDYSGAQLTEINRIVSEALINVVKHTDTKQAIVRGESLEDIFRLQVIDFGEGAVMKKKSGHFGMQGMHERATALDGALTVVSTPGEGTTVTLTMPVTKKEQL